ncbi:ArnT family glycosyltransferase [Ottowia testudinis]|uniref:Glycosyltransferase family 39 protein n=1 Tax=Ottowia testudinis TaxID=2816950 RepID=A0A975CMQ6_9BURK|nr:glycosyltransferase family 39 protein [Ottowia testudinis]QTD46333.1 glycosyltransferase family 39 protein [Ottowia testudinis]
MAVSALSSTPADPARPAVPPFARAPSMGAAMWAVVAWVTAYALVRVALSPALKWDYGEQMLWSQQLAWGYGAQPPLYTWLQWGANALFGPSVLALAAVKGWLIALTMLFWMLAARVVMPAPWAPAAALGTLLLPVSLWIGIRDVTHTLLVSCTIAAFWWLLLRQLRRPSLGGFVALGVAMAAAVLSKYNAVLVIGAAALAALSLAPTRRALLSRGWPWAPWLAAALLAPHAAWLLGHWDMASADTLEKLHRGAHASGGWLRDVVTGLASLLPLLLATLLPWALALSWAFGRGIWRRAALQPAAGDQAPPAWLGALLLRHVLLVLGGLLVMVLLGATRFDGRWLHPLLACVPVLGFAWWIRQPPDARARRRWLGLLATLAGVVLALPAVDTWRDARRGAPERFNWPVDAMARTLRYAGYDGRSLIVANHMTLGGTLRTVFPAARVVACDASDDEGLVCMARAVQGARRARQGWLLVSADHEAPREWWAAAGVIEDANVGALLQRHWLAYRGAGPHMVPMRFDFRWQPPALAVADTER